VIVCSLNFYYHNLFKIYIYIYLVENLKDIFPMQDLVVVVPSLDLARVYLLFVSLHLIYL
jgi:hypothetical protein